MCGNRGKKITESTVQNVVPTELRIRPFNSFGTVAFTKKNF
jgi:hypothetical protein